MKRPASLSRLVRRPQGKDERGVTLVTTLLLLLLLTGMSLTMVLSVSSDMLVNGYYRNFRSSFYAADSGANIARQALVNGLTGQINGSWSSAVSPLGSSAAGTVQSSVNSTYGGTSFTAINGGSAAGSWPEKFKITSITLAPVATPAQPVTTTDSKGVVNSYTYTYNYSMTAVGQSQGTEAATMVDNGSIIFYAALTNALPQNVNFAAWGMFIDQYDLCSANLVAGTITGPVFTNGSWNYGTGKYTYTDPVGQAGANAGFDNGSKCVGATTPPSGFSVNFQQGFSPSQNKIPLPTNSYNQKQAVLDGIGNSSTTPSNSAMNSVLKDAKGNAYPKSGASTGVYLPFTTDSKGNLVMTGGGILVEGDAKVTLQPTGTSAQQYVIVNNSATTTITIDPSANGGVGSTTITTAGLGTQVISGVPQAKDSTGTITGDATMLYVDGNITQISGPGEGKAAIQDATALTITAANDVTITGDILYKSEPVTMSGTPLDQVIPANNTGQVLGIFTASGNVNLNNKQSDSNLEIDASVATISQSGSGGIVNTGNAINTLTIVGGRIQNSIQNINSTTRNVFFDRRFASNGFAPPWFPSTTVTPPSGTTTKSITSSIQRTQWLNQTSYQ